MLKWPHASFGHRQKRDVFCTYKSKNLRLGGLDLLGGKLFKFVSTRKNIEVVKQNNC